MTYEYSGFTERPSRGSSVRGISGPHWEAEAVQIQIYRALNGSQPEPCDPTKEHIKKKRWNQWKWIRRTLKSPTNEMVRRRLAFTRKQRQALEQTLTVSTDANADFEARLEEEKAMRHRTTRVRPQDPRRPLLWTCSEHSPPSVVLNDHTH
jgi:hypothetical protein